MDVIGYYWCTYRTWSFQLLESLLDLEVAKPLGIITTQECLYDFELFERRGIPIIRANPKQVFAADSPSIATLAEQTPKCLFFYGWSWMVPARIHRAYLSVTLHPGKLPNDRGGSPLQNQIRAGEEWSYANIIELVDQVDGGDVFLRSKFSLRGDIADVWSRMVGCGAHLTRTFLSDMAAGRLHRTPQPVAGRAYRRVTPAQGELLPQAQTAVEMYNIVRAHNETDPNTYVRRAFIQTHGRRYVFSAAATETDERVSALPRFAVEQQDTDPYEICCRVNNDEACLGVIGADGRTLLVTRYYISAV